MTTPWRTLRGRLALGSIVGLLAASIVFAVLGVELVRSQSLTTEQRELEVAAKGIAKIISDDVAREIQDGSYRPTRERIDAFEAIVGTGTELTYDGPNLDPDPRGEPSALQKRTLAEIDDAIMERDGVQRFSYTVPETGVEVLAAAGPITLAEGTIGHVVISREREAFGTVWRQFANRVLVASLIGLAIALLVTLLVTKRALRPLKRLEAASVEVGGGNLDARVDTGGAEELSAVANAFNGMVRELKHRDMLTRDFLMRVTHDLRTPLTAIRGHTQALADGVVPDEAVPRSLKAIEGESGRLEALVTDLLDLAKLEARRFRLDLEEIDGNALVEQAFDAYAGEAARRGVTYQHDGDPLPTLYTDAARVRQIVGNLIDNAFRWTPDGGIVRVLAHPRPAGGAVISVTDSGPGIAPDQLIEIFEPFRSENTPDGRHGSGLGLAISRQLARALGGDLRVESRLGDGSRFILELPQEARQTSMAAGSKP